MAEDIGNLVVKVAMEDTSFQRGVQNLNRSMRKAQAEFKNATAGVKDHGRGLDGLKSKSTMLSKKVEAQNKIVKMNKDRFKESKDTLDKNVEAQTKLKDKVDKAKKAYEESKKTLGENAEETKKLKSEYENLSTEYDANNEKIQNNVRSMDNWEIKANNSEAKLKDLQSELDKTNKEIDKQSSKWYKLSEKLEPVGKKMQSVGQKMSDIGKDMTLKLTTPIAGVGVAAAKLGMDFESSMSAVQATTQSSGEEMKQLETKAREMGSGTSKSAKDAADAMQYLGLAGWDTGQIMAGIEPILRLSEAGNIDLARAADLTTNSMSAMGLSVEELPHYLDVLAQAARSSNTDIDQMGQAYIGVGGTLRGLNVPLEESAVILEILANKGVKGSEAGTSLNAVITNLTAPTGRAKKALEELNLSAFDGKGEFKGLTNVLMEVKEKTEGMTDAQKNQILAMLGGKEHVKDLNALLNGLEEDYGTLSTAIDGADGALNDMAKTMQANNKGSITELKSAIEELGLKIYDVLRPKIASIIETLQKWTDKLNNLTPAQQKTIIKIAEMLAVAGPLLTIIGKLTEKLGGAVIGFARFASKVAEAGGVMKAFGISLVGIKFTAVIAGAVALSVAIAKLVKHFKKASLESDVFGKEVSAGTQKAVDGFLELDKQASVALKQLNWSATNVTKDMADKITNNVGQMKDRVVGKLNEQKNESVSKIQEMVNASDTLTAEEQQKITEKTQMGFDKKIKITEDGNAKIAEIMNNAAQNNRALTDAEYNTINEIKRNMVKQGIEVLSEGEKEQMAIMERLNQQSGEMSAEQAAEVVKNSKKQLDNTKANAEKEYNERLKYAAMLRAEGGEENEKLADKVAEEAQRQYDEAVTKAEATHEGVIRQAQAQAGEHVNYVDWEKGEVLNKWQAMWVGVSTWAENIKESVKQSFQRQLEAIRQKNQEIHQTIAIKWNQILGYFSTLPARLRQKGIQMFEGLRQGIQAKHRAVTAKAREVGQSIVNTFRNFPARLRAKGIQMFDGMGQGIRSKRASVRQRANEVGQSIRDAFRNLPGNLRQVGSNIMHSLAQGIKGAIRAPINAAREAAQRVNNKFKEVLDIHSPSGVFRGHGHDIDGGLALGILDDLDKVENATETMSKAVAKTKIGIGIVKDVGSYTVEGVEGVESTKSARGQMPNGKPISTKNITVVQHIYPKTESPSEMQRLSKKEYEKLAFTMG